MHTLSVGHVICRIWDVLSSQEAISQLRLTTDDTLALASIVFFLALFVVIVINY